VIVTPGEVTLSRTAVAVIVALPTALAVTNPLALTVAIAVLLDFQVIVRPVTTVAPFVAVAVSCPVDAFGAMPATLRVATVGDT
jgi:hypothetical protein